MFSDEAVRAQLPSLQGKGEAISVSEKQDFHKSVLVLLPGMRKQMEVKKLGRKTRLARIELVLTQAQLAQRINAK